MYHECLSGNKGGGSLPEVHDFRLDQKDLQGPKMQIKYFFI